VRRTLHRKERAADASGPASMITGAATGENCNCSSAAVFSTHEHRANGAGSRIDCAVCGVTSLLDQRTTARDEAMQLCECCESNTEARVLQPFSTSLHLNINRALLVTNFVTNGERAMSLMSRAQMSRNHVSPQYAIFATICVAALALLPVDSYAQGTAPSREVHYSDLDLAKQADVEKLYKRLRAAGNIVCSNPLLTGQYNDCFNDAIARAVASIDNSNLTALYRGDGRMRIANESRDAPDRS
jgi:UrcA family protein